jgi:signal peptidase I
MNFNFELILFYAIVVTGVIALFDLLFLAKKRKDKPLPIIIDYARAFFPILLLVFVLRSFLFEPFRIPSSSLEPTLLVGDFIIVNKFDYGLRLPVLHTKIFPINEPKTGDVIVFRWPPRPSIDFIKRVIGVPGDRISYIDKVLYVNGEKIPQEFKENVSKLDEQGSQQDLVRKVENLLGREHAIYQNSSSPQRDFKDLLVPEGMYYVMGDNRDDSADSRFWGFVPEENIVGKAIVVWMSWNSMAQKVQNKVRWDRVGKQIYKFDEIPA